MLMRLFLALLFAAFALPAAAPAACHGEAMATPQPMTAMAGHIASDADREDADRGVPDHKAVAVHGCIGCIPPSAWTALRIDDVLPAETAAPIEWAAVFDLGRTAAPALRPPRTA
jgi:hypothetical protein